jgi:hypothetical protein
VDQDPGSGAFLSLDLEWGKSGSGINIQDLQYQYYKIQNNAKICDHFSHTLQLTVLKTFKDKTNIFASSLDKAKAISRKYSKSVKARVVAVKTYCST